MALKSLDDPSSMLAQLFAGEDVTGALSGLTPNTAKSVKQRKYRSLARGINVLSYSNFELYHTCERKFGISKLRAATSFEQNVSAAEDTNLHLTYGKCFETGIQSTLLGKEWHQVWFDMFIAWDMYLIEENQKTHPGKTFTECVLAVEQFYETSRHIYLSEWEVATFDGKPAIELSFVIDMGNGYFFMGHVDVVLRHKFTGEFMVLELKTTARPFLHEALYKNSPQALGYSIVIDRIAADASVGASYQVLYLGYHTAKHEYFSYPFTKSRTDRAEWLNTIILDMQEVHRNRELAFFPKRAQSCLAFNRPCQFFETCSMDIFQGGLREFTEVTIEEIEAHEFDFRFKLSELIETQEELIS